MTLETITPIIKEYWYKPDVMLHRQWALIDNDQSHGCRVYFYIVPPTKEEIESFKEEINRPDYSPDFVLKEGVFDEMTFISLPEAEQGLRKNGFTRQIDRIAVGTAETPPDPPFHRVDHEYGPIYSSGAA